MISEYLELCKPKVVALMILTSFAGMCLADSAGSIWIPLIFGNLGIALVASAAAVLNHIADQHVDGLMKRTQHRPLVQGKISTYASVVFSFILCTAGTLILFLMINTLTAVLTFCSLIGYAVVYTLYLKPVTPQNIVIGGIAGAVPPLLGWTAVTGTIHPHALLLVLIIFIWTPPHFWALAIYRFEDYAKAKIPMLPNTHGIAYTKLNILLYTILLILVSVLPYLAGMSHRIYLAGVSLADAGFLFSVLRLYVTQENTQAFKTFKVSIYYLGFLFLLLLTDHYLSR